ncbi:hypothetical protein [Halobellus rubicundus]|uniref:Uncharacterized protein n=1 Tax=Halobellus rubicundus TaxID=2996466 RepID=A0ABD5MHG8_9EURY
MSDSALPPEGSKRHYRRVLGVIHKNTGHGRRPMYASHALWTKLGEFALSRSEARSALKAARENDAVIRWKDGEGQLRYGLTPDGVDELPDATMPIYTPEDVDALQAVIEREASRPEHDQNQDVIGWANQHLQAIREGSDD